VMSPVDDADVRIGGGEDLPAVANPVLTVGPHVSRENSVAGFSNIVSATDFGDESLAALPQAISFAQQHRGRLCLLQV
jgi:hypothetical protein